MKDEEGNQGKSRKRRQTSNDRKDDEAYVRSTKEHFIEANGTACKVEIMIIIIDVSPSKLIERKNCFFFNLFV